MFLAQSSGTARKRRAGPRGGCQQQVPRASVSQEVLDGQPDLMGRLIDYGGDGEPADARIG
jgi:hypothetical protein